ncbi:SoxR reducing system RseC family protein [Agaribacterium sp. ZY112]|uniref:SoxR reducing system RseC family protein n=1 Tax=Agaribacterium sp. ZY112 TaxID=3233574 RepID=UPI0035243A18
MLTENGRVLAVEDDGLWVETLQQSACAQCSARSGCGQKLLGEALMPNMTSVKAYFSEPPTRIFRVGEQVDIGIAEHALLTATLLAYLVPLLALLFGAGVFQFVFASEWLSLVGALFGLAVGGLLVRAHARRNRSNPLFHPVVL